MTLSRTTVFLLLVGIAAAAQQAPAALPLRSHVELHASVLRFSDLALGEVTHDAVIAAAPQPGCIRTISRTELRPLLEAHGIDANAYTLPEEVTVERWQRTLSSEELHNVLSSALSEQMPGVTISGEPAGHVRVTTEQPQLQVTQIQILRSQSLGRFRVKVANEPDLHEFWVSCRIRSARETGTDATLDLHSPAVHPHAPPKLKPAVLAKVNAPAALRVFGEGFEFTTTVTPLENGALGQTIRVREDATGRLMRAEVIGPEQLQSGTQVTRGEQRALAQ